MLNFIKGNIFDEIEDYEAIVNTVNCVGVMGKGIALEFKTRFPENFTAYSKACKNKELKIGKSLIYVLKKNNNTKYIVNFPTKMHWRNPSKLEYIEQGLDDLVEIINKYKIKSIILPALGCGNGLLDWSIVKPLIENKLQGFNNTKITVIEPSEKIIVKKPKLTVSRKRLLLIFNHYNQNSKSGNLTYIEASTLAYFLSIYDKEINLDFELRKNGVYSQKINALLLALNGYYLQPDEHSKHNPKPIKVNTVNFPKVKEILRDPIYIETIQLIEGFENPSNLFALATAYWYMTEENTRYNNINAKVNNWINFKSNKNIEPCVIDKTVTRLKKIFELEENLKLNLE